MDANTWLWIGVIVLLIVCCGPMLFMRRHTGQTGRHRNNDDGRSSGRR